MVWVLIGLGACYAPGFASGIPCAPNGDCPGSQVCDRNRPVPTCVGTLPAPDASSSIDSPLPVDAFTGLGPWSTPKLVSISAPNDDDPTLTGDLLELHFNRAGDILVTQRASVADDWTTPTLVAELSTTAGESTPEISLDGLTIFFTSNRTAATKIFTSTRASRASVWAAPVLVPELNSTAEDTAGGLRADGLEILLTSTRSDGANHDLYRSTRSSVSEAWSAPVPIAEVNTLFQDESGFLADDLTLYFDAASPDANFDLFISTRASTSHPFQPPQRIPELETTGREHDPWVSPDGHHMFFVSNRDGSGTTMLQLYETSR